RRSTTKARRGLEVLPRRYEDRSLTLAAADGEPGPDGPRRLEVRREFTGRRGNSSDPLPSSHGAVTRPGGGSGPSRGGSPAGPEPPEDLRRSDPGPPQRRARRPGADPVAAQPLGESGQRGQVPLHEGGEPLDEGGRGPALWLQPAKGRRRGGQRLVVGP